MKRIEWMAGDWIRGNIGGKGALIVNHSDTHVENGASAAYQAGFRAAREMAAKDMREMEATIQDLAMAANRPDPDTSMYRKWADHFAALGEDEAPDGA